MSKRIFIVVFSFLCSVQFSFSQSGKICNWTNDKKAAVVLTFDDWTPGHFYIVYPELQARNLNATFFVTTNGVSNWSNLNTVVSAGNEVGNHSESHPDLTKLTATQIGNEIRGAKTILDKNITSRVTYSYAYPYGTFNVAIIDSLKSSGHIASRGVWQISDYSYNFATIIDDYFNTRIFGIDSSVSISQFYAQIKNVINGGGFLTYLCHVVANASYPDNSAVQQAQLKQELDTLVSVKDKVWITTYSNALKYHREKRCAKLSEIQAPNGVQWIVNLTDTLSNNSVYNYPLSIKLKINTVNYDKILQNGNPLTIDAIANDTIMFRAVPDGGQIVLKVSTGISITSPTITPSTVSNNVSNNVSFQVTATDDGSISNVTINLTPIGGSPAFILNSIGKNNYSGSYSIAVGIATGIKTLIVTATDNVGNTNTIPITLNITSGTIISNLSVSPSTIINNKVNTVIFAVTTTDDGSINSVLADLTSIGGGSSMKLINTNNNDYSLTFNVLAGASIGNKSIPVSVIDNMGNVTTTQIPITIKASITYLDVYTDVNPMVCSTCIYAGNGTITEQSNAGAIEGVKDLFFSYSIASWWAGAGLNVSNWSAANAKDFSTYDSLQISYLGPIGNGAITLSLTDASGNNSATVTLPASNAYTTKLFPIEAFTGVDLTKNTQLNIAAGGVSTGNGTLRIDNIRLLKVEKTINTTIGQIISLNAGWNLISINVRPNDSTIATIFKGLNIVEIKTMDSFWNTVQNTSFNSITSMIPGQGYLVKMNTSGIITLQGFAINQSIPSTKTGWQLIGCSYQTATSFSAIFNSNNCLCIKNFDGFWIPNGTTNSIQNFEPSKGYFIKGK